MDDWYAKGGFVSKETLERAFTGEKSEVTAYIDKQEEKCEKKGLTYEEWLEEKKEKKRKEDEQKELLKAEKKYKYLAIKVNKEELYNILTQLETMSEVTWFTGDKPTEYNIYKNRGYKPEHLIYLYYTCEENCLGWNSVEGHEREYTEISRESITVEYFINNVCKLHNKEK